MIICVSFVIFNHSKLILCFFRVVIWKKENNLQEPSANESNWIFPIIYKLPHLNIKAWLIIKWKLIQNVYVFIDDIIKQQWIDFTYNSVTYKYLKYSYCSKKLVTFHCSNYVNQYTYLIGHAIKNSLSEWEIIL